MNKSIFRSYDIRGIAQKDFDAAWVENLGRACALLMREKNIFDAILGFDCRTTSLSYHNALARGLMSSGISVISIGMVPTPLLYFAVRHLGRKAAIMVTASHNPPQYNGFKIWLGKTTIHGDDIQRLASLMQTDNFPVGQGIFSQFDILPAYVEAIKKRIKLSDRLKIVVDGGNGAAGEVCCQVLHTLGAEIFPLYCEPDGKFPNHHPDPTVEENTWDMARYVHECGADFGVGLDGDGDRLGVVDKNGRLLYGDELLSIFATDLLKRKPGALIIGDVKCSTRFFEDVRARGGKAVMSATGHSLIKAKMLESGADLAGELSGHMFFAEGWFGFDDAIYAAAKLAHILSARQRQLEDLPGWPTAFTTREINIPCPEELKVKVIERVRKYFSVRYRINTLDGARVEFSDGFGLIRASNTQPILVSRFEASSKERLAAIKDEMLTPLAKWIEEEEKSYGRVCQRVGWHQER